MHFKDIDYGLVHELECIFIYEIEMYFFLYVTEYSNYIRLYPIILYQNVSIKIYRLYIYSIIFYFIYIYIHIHGEFYRAAILEIFYKINILKVYINIFYKYWKALFSIFMTNIKSNTMGYLFVPTYIGIQLGCSLDIICNYFLWPPPPKECVSPYKRIFIGNAWFKPLVLTRSFDL